ncbi:MAG: hypothetical protein AB9842_00515 [Bacteroidales bacterium]
MHARKFFVSSLLFVWQLPQNILGISLLIFLKIWKGTVKIEFSRNRFFIPSFFSVSLGLFIFYQPSAADFGHPDFNFDLTKEHEYGHSIQSQLLGPLYLFVIGLPSLLWAIYFQSRYKKNNAHGELYFKAYTEKWADKLAKIKRFQDNP